MSTSGSVVIYIEFPIWRWRYDPVLNASVLSANASMRVYIFHDRQFQTPVRSPFFRPHQPFGEVTLDDIRPYFQPPRYPTDDDEMDSDARVTPTASVDSDPSEPSYPSYHVETDPSEPAYPTRSGGSHRSSSSQPSVVRLSSDTSASSAGPTPPPVRGRGFIRTRAIPRGRGRARGGGRSDGPSDGYGNGFLPPDA